MPTCRSRLLKMIQSMKRIARSLVTLCVGQDWVTRSLKRWRFARPVTAVVNRPEVIFSSLASVLDVLDGSLTLVIMIDSSCVAMPDRVETVGPSGSIIRYVQAEGLVLGGHSWRDC